jgi:hypothetical protein
MRTTIRLDDDLLSAAKQHAAKTGRTLTSLFEDALRAFLAVEQRPSTRRRTRLPTFDGGGLQSGVDLDNTADLLDLMEGSDADR